MAICERFQVAARACRPRCGRPAGGRAPADVVRFARVRSQDFAAPQVAIEARGEAIAIWTRVTRGGAVVQSASRRAGGGWGSPADVSARGRYGATAQVAFDANATGWRSGS